MLCFCEMCSEYFDYDEIDKVDGYRINEMDIGVCPNCMEFYTPYELLPIIEDIIKEMYTVNNMKKEEDE